MSSPKKIRTGFCLQTSNRWSRSTPALLRKRPEKRSGVEMEPSYQGTFSSAKRHVLHTFATTHSALMQETGFSLHAQHRMPTLPWQAACGSKRSRSSSRAWISADLSRMPLKRLGYHRWQTLRRGPGKQYQQCQASGKSYRDAPDCGRYRGTACGAARSGAGVSDAGTQHTYPFAGRVATFTAGDPGPLQLIWRHLRARRALRWVFIPADTEALLTAFERLRIGRVIRSSWWNTIWM